MKPGLIVTLVLLSISSIVAVAFVFFNGKSQPAVQKNSSAPTIDIKWGEGSEAGAPENAVAK